VPAYGQRFVYASIDGYELSVRQYAVWASRGVVSLIALVGVAVHVIVLVLVGAVARLALLCNGRLRLGQTVVGRGVVGLLALGTCLGLRIWERQWCQQKE
jgi:hypothetical protein